MSKQEGVVIASRALAVLMTVWALVDVSYLPEHVQSFVHYMYYERTPSTNLQYLQYMQHTYLISLCFLMARLIGYSLLAWWLFKGGPEVSELLLPSSDEQQVVAQEHSPAGIR